MVESGSGLRRPARESTTADGHLDYEVANVYSRLREETVSSLSGGVLAPSGPQGGTTDDSRLGEVVRRRGESPAGQELL